MADKDTADFPRMKLWEDMSPEEEIDFRRWARENYKPFEPIKGIWHPVVQDECVKINREEGMIR